MANAHPDAVEPNPRDFPSISSFFEQPVPDHLLDPSKDSSWPERLLHVPSWTSCIRQHNNTYRDIKEPKYNILSYTWGRWRLPSGPSLPIAGVDWPVPPVDPDHFKVEDFKGAIQAAAAGVDFIWVDIACIPQEHSSETKDAIRTRGTEIGKQAAIFARATDSFVWLCNMNLDDVFVDGRIPSFRSLNAHLMCLPPATADAAAEYVDLFDKIFTSIERCINTLMTHPWLSSLWTLQECVLRPHSWLLFGNGELLFEEGLSHAWTTTTVRELFASISELTLTEDRAKLLRKAESTTVDQALPHMSRLGYTKLFTERVNEKVVAFRKSGLNFKLGYNPNIVYSAAQYRTVSRPLDRIYGIIQIYGLSCTPFPMGHDDDEKLASLEDEFGSKLVAQSPVMSQLFTHMADPKPRRTWLITQNSCVHPDLIEFRSTWVGESNSLCEMSVETDSGHLEFRGKAWNLLEFTKDAFSPERQLKGSFMVHKHAKLLLDQHITKPLKLETNEEVKGENMYPVLQNLMASHGRKLKLLLIGGARAPSPIRRYIGLVVMQSESGNDQVDGAGSCWERLGLLTWFGVVKFYDLTKGEPKTPLPAWHETRCFIR